MAKSIRSKHRRKMRAVKREKFGKKELERLKGVVKKAKEKDDVEVMEILTGNFHDLTFTSYICKSVFMSDFLS